MTNHYKIAIIGAGPAGLSAAGRAAFHDQQCNQENNQESNKSGDTDPSYVLLESFDKPAKTIQRYQKGKLVMAEPGYLALRSDFSFEQASREEVLGGWANELVDQNVNIRYNSEVAAISGELGNFTLNFKDGKCLKADNVVIAVGLEGNPRKLGVPGEDLPVVQYTLDDPGACNGETIVVVGAGDSAIENALALAKNNQVYLLNRRDEFSRAKEGNLNAVLKANADENTTLSVYYSTSAQSVSDEENGTYTMVLNTPDGDVSIDCHRIIARLGGIPPRRFVESSGVVFPNAKPGAIPDLSDKYQSNVPGVYIIGSLAGYPLIKQALNQGYDVIEYILGNTIKPADHPLLDLQFKLLPYKKDVDELIRLFQQRIPIFKRMNALQFRELVIESNILVAYEGEMYESVQAKAVHIEKALEKRKQKPKYTKTISAGDYIYREGDYSNSFFTIVEGEVTVDMPGINGQQTYTRGQFFGENSLLSGRPRLGNAIANSNCIIVETPRRIMVKLMNSNDDVREGIDLVFIVRTLQRLFAPNLSSDELVKFAGAAELRTFKPGEVIFKEGDKGQSLHFMRSGSVTLSRMTDDKDIVVAQYQTGKIIGQMALMGDAARRETATANVFSETIELTNEILYRILEADTSTIESFQDNASSSAILHTRMEVRPEIGSVTDFLMDEGLGEATNCLIIDESLCVGCDNCEKACAETHGGISRLDREAGTSFANVHVPFSCRHCAQPHCMKDCPPNAIHRSASGEVHIDGSCIGCGNCETNCPYSAIKLAYDAPKKPGLFAWLFLGKGDGPGEEAHYSPSKEAKDKGKKAVKCDACMDLPSGPACVNSCPTGAAMRMSPDQFIELVEKR